jgi:hypothetical protein
MEVNLDANSGNYEIKNSYGSPSKPVSSQRLALVWSSSPLTAAKL